MNRELRLMFFYGVLVILTPVILLAVFLEWL